MGIGNVDKVTTQKLRKREDRGQKLEKSVALDEKDISIPSTSGLKAKKRHITLNEPETEVESGESTENTDEDFKWTYPLSRKRKRTDATSTSTSQMRLSMPHTALASDLTGASNRAVAKITTAVLADFDLVSPKQQKYIIDKNKVRREVAKKRRELREKGLSAVEGAAIKSLYFDGRKDDTLQKTCGHQKLASETHVALIEEPGSKYIGHLSLTAGESAKEISQGIIYFAKKYNMSMLNLSVIGCDGTNVNTGWKGGVIRLLETYLKRPLQWNICLLHTNELPLRHLILEIDGCTKGPHSYSGPIGQLLRDCEKNPVVKFSKIDCNLLALDMEDLKKLSTEQQYLYRICLAIKDGSCPSSVANSSPGKLSHARWLTTANRLLRLYVGTPSPSENFVLLFKYVMLVYAPMWFEIKMKPNCQSGAQHFWKMISLARQFPDNVKQILFKVFSNNAYFAHPEQLLLTMLFDSRKCIRELAVRRILNTRNKKKKSSDSVRFFKLPKLNFEAADNVDLVDWANCAVTEPPITMHLEDQDLKNMCKEQPTDLNFEEFPCHTQAVERCVKLITEAAVKVCGETARDGYIRAKLQARKELPSFDNKGQYYSKK